MTATWHVDDAALARWVDGNDGSVTGASVEQHLLSCADCRARVPADPVVDQVWERVRDAVEIPRAALLERLLERIGLSQADARIVAVSPAFRGAWVVGLTALLVFVTIAGGIGSGKGEWLFLLVAPMVPALAVALGYDAELDEALETECATPYSRLRLVLLRSAALLLAAVPAFLAANLLLPGQLAYWWLAPAAGCTALVLALSTWWPSVTSAGVVGTAWLAVVGSRFPSGQPGAVLGDEWMIVYAVAFAAGLVLLCTRRSRLAWGSR